MSIKTILVPTDFSEHAQRAFEIGLSLARQLGASLHLLHVQHESSLRTAIREGLFKPDATDEELRATVAELNEHRLCTILATADVAGAEIIHCTRRGESAIVISDYAAEFKADLMVVGRRGISLMDTLRTGVLGSVAETLIRKSPCPVLVVRREHTLG
jgi:nucleotide-binding universal stress UspA family protein